MHIHVLEVDPFHEPFRAGDRSMFEVNDPGEHRTSNIER